MYLKAASALLFICSSVVALSQPIDESMDVAEHNAILAQLREQVQSLYLLMKTQRERDIEFINNYLNDTFEPLRTKRDVSESEESSKASKQFTETLLAIKEGFSDLMKNLTNSDVYNQMKKFGEDVSKKGKEIGSKIEETIKGSS